MRYRKRPVEIEAVQFTGGDESAMAIKEFSGERFFCWHINSDTIWIDTLEGRMCAARGDYIIRGVAGEFYPCKPDIFQRTYEQLP